MHSALGCIHFTLGATTQQKPVENITKQAAQNNYHNLSAQKARKPLACARFSLFYVVLLHLYCPPQHTVQIYIWNLKSSNDVLILTNMKLFV